MIEILKSSLLVRLFDIFCGWCSRQWKQSRIIRALLDMKDDQAVGESSIFYRLGVLLKKVMTKLFELLHLGKLFDGSLIFARPFLWCFIAAVMAPLIPTMLLLAIVMMACISTMIDTCLHPERRLASSHVNRYVIMYAAVYLIATLTSVTLSGSLMIGLLTTVFIMSVFTYENAITTKQQVRLIIWGMVAAGTLVALYGIYQYVTGANMESAWTDEEMFTGITKRVYSTLQNPNVLAEYLLLLIPLSVACVLTAKNLPARFLFLCTTGAMCLCMLLTFSRGGWLGLIIAVGVFLVLLDARLIFVGILGLVLLMLMSPEIIISRFSSIGNLTDGSTSYRVSIWLGTIAMLKDYWLTGIGPGADAYNMIYPHYSYNAVVAPHSHNLYLQVMCDAGICGIIVFMMLLIVFVRRTCTAISRETNRESRIYQISVLSSMGGYLAQGMTDYSFYNYRVMCMFWVFIAMSTIYCRMSDLPEGKPFPWSRSGRHGDTDIA